MPDYLFACAGGGSNLAGTRFPFLRENLAGRGDVDIVACEPAAAPSLTQGEFRYDFGDSSGMTPLLKMYTLGNDFVPDPVHAGGLRYHGMAPLVIALLPRGPAAARSRSSSARRSRPGVLFARAEGIVPASESQPRDRGRPAGRCARPPRRATSPVILIGVSGSGQLDLPAYAEYLTGDMLDA